MAVQREEGARRFALAAAELAATTRCQDVVLLDLRGRSPVTEYFVIATGTSPRQMRTVIDEIVDLGGQTGFSAWQQSGYETARWIVLDCVNVVVHVFDSESRDFYDLELLWGDSPRVDWRKELGLPADYAPPTGRLEEEVEDVWETEEEVDAEAGDADMDEEAEADLPVVTEVPDESTGSNSVELVESDPPGKRGKKGRDAFPTTVEEDEDMTEEEQAMGGVSAVAEAAEELEEEEVNGGGDKERGRQGAGKKVTKEKKKAVKKAVRKVTKKVTKEAVKKAVRKIAKKVTKKGEKEVKKVEKGAKKGVLKGVKKVKKAVKVVKAGAKKVVKKSAKSKKK